MKNFLNLLFGYLLLINMSFTVDLEFDSFYPIKKVEMQGNEAGDNFGRSVSCAGDIDKDGYDDVIIAAFSQNSNRGVVYVIYGGETTSLDDIDLSSSTLDPLKTGFTIAGNAADDALGYSASSAGDIDKDGYADIIIGAPYKDSSRGAAYIIYGGERTSMSNIDLSSLTLSPTSTGFMVTGNSANDNFGISVSSAGDVDQDEYDDLIIGASTRSSNQGVAYVLYGGDRSSMSNLMLSSTTLIPTSTGFTVTGNTNYLNLGRSVSSAGDVNKDGYADIIIGAYHSKGAAYVIYGGPKSSMSNILLSSTPLSPLTGFTITGSTVSDNFGWSVSSAGDIDNDGYADIIIGAYGVNSQQGAAYVVYGGDKSGLSNIDFSTSGSALDPGTTGFTITGSAEEDCFGRSVSSAGDINQDGYDDIIIGAPYKNIYQGAAYVIYGGDKSSMSNIALEMTTSLGALGFMITGNATGDVFGISVSKAGDVNGDDIPDFIIGASGANSDTGAAYLVLDQCPSNCKTCNVSTSCEACLSPYLLYYGQCIDSCPIKTFKSNNGAECEDCPSECSECIDKSACQDCVAGYTLSGSKCKKVETETGEIEENRGMKAATGIFEGTSLAGAALGSGSSLPLNFGIVAKILRNIKYMDLPVSSDLYETFVSWKVASGFMSAPDSWDLKYSSKTIPTVFSRYELQSAFMINFWKPFSMALVGIAFFGIFKVIEVYMKKENKKENKMSNILRQINIAASNFALTQFYSNLDDVMLYFILELKSTKFETGFRVCSSVMAIFLFLLGGLFIGVHSKLISSYQNLKGRESIIQLKGFESKCENISLIFKDFKDTNSLIQSFLVVNVVRSVISSFIFVVLFEYPMIQIAFLFVLNILMIMYLWKKKSFKEFSNTCGQIFCEVVLFFANICVFLLALFDHADYYPVTAIENISTCIIALNFILLIGCALLLLVNLVKPIYKSYLDRNKAQQISQPPNILASTKFNRPGPDLNQSNQSLSTLNNESSQNASQSDSYKNPLINKNCENLERGSIRRQNQGVSQNYSIQKQARNQSPAEGLEMSNSKVKNSHHDHLERGSIRRQNQGISQNYSIQERNQNPKENLDMSNSNVILQSSQTEDFGEEISQTNLFSNNTLPRSRLMRNREITKARIAQFSQKKENSRHGSPESRIEDPSFHSRMGLNQDSLSANQDTSLTSFDIGAESPPLRGNDFIPRTKTRENRNVTFGN